MRENKALSAWRADGQTIGCWLSLANAYSAEAIANLGFDWVCVDLQHGLIDHADLATMLPAISTSQATPLVRVPWNEPYEIMKALDAGAYGVIVPMVNNREEAEQAVWPVDIHRMAIVPLVPFVVHCTVVAGMPRTLIRIWPALP